MPQEKTDLEDLLIPREAAPLMRKTPGALAVDRCQRRDTPDYIKIGRRIYYRRSDILKWVSAHVVNVNPIDREQGGAR